MSELALQTSLWLEVSFADRSWLFELKSGEDRAVVVGSNVNADVLVVRPGVGSTHFHFEREDDAILLVPGYRAALRVNSLRAVDPVVLPERATIELLNLSLQVVTHVKKPEHLRITEPPPSPSQLAPRDYFENLPDETEPTGFTLAPSSTTVLRYDFDTVEAPRPTFDTEPLPRVAFEPDGANPVELPRTPTAPSGSPRPDYAPLGPQGTVMLVVPNLDGEAPKAHSAATTRPWLGRDNASPPPTVTERLPVPHLEAVPRPGQATSPVPMVRADIAKATELELPQAFPHGRTHGAAETTRVEVPAPHRFSAPASALDLPVPATPGVRAAPPPEVALPPIGAAAPMSAAVATRALLPAAVYAPLAAQRTADFDVSAVAALLITPPSGVLPARGERAHTSSTAPVTSNPTPRAHGAPSTGKRPRARAMSYLALLGTEALRRPVLVGAAAAAAAALLALALVGASRFTTRRVAPPARVSVASPARLSVPAGGAAALTSATGTSALAATPATPPTPPPEQQAPAAQDVAAAVNHLLGGRRQEAGSAYRQLSAADPSNPTYAAIARMLAERALARCSATPPPNGCPEVLP